MERPMIQAADVSTMTGLPTWLVIAALAAVVLAVVLGRGDRGRGGRRRSSRRGGRVRGLPVLLVIGLLLGATALGSDVVRTVVTTIVHAMNSLGGLYGG